MPFEDFVNFFIELLEGKADQLRGKDMAGRKKLTPVVMSEDRNVRLLRWNELSKQIAEMKNEENQLRQAIVLELFDATKLEGTQTVDLGNGWRLKSTKNQNYSATNESGQTETLLNTVGAIDQGLAAGLVKWKPEISTKVYRDVLALVGAHPELAVPLAAAITVKPGMPELELISPDALTPSVESGVV